MTLTRRRVSPKVRSIRLECRMRLRCSAGNSKWTRSASRLSATQATAEGYSGLYLAMKRLARRRPSATAAWPSASMSSKIAQ
jgi:hypothetical protein